MRRNNKMTDTEKLEIYEAKIDVSKMKKINDAIDKGKDVEIKTRKDKIAIFVKTISRID